MKTLVVSAGISEKIDELSNIFKFYDRYNTPMSAKIWKCYRCNLTFKEETSADLHKNLSAHNVSAVNTIEV